MCVFVSVCVYVCVCVRVRACVCTSRYCAKRSTYKDFMDSNCPVTCASCPQVPVVRTTTAVFGIGADCDGVSRHCRSCNLAAKEVSTTPRVLTPCPTLSLSLCTPPYQHLCPYDPITQHATILTMPL